MTPAAALPPLLARYAGVAGDAEAFARALARPLPLAGWVHPMRATVEDVAALLAEDGYAAAPIPGLPHGIRLEATRDDARALSTTEAYTLGLFHRQGAVSQVPVLLLGARPGARVLDLCAAPGGKTAQVALAMHDDGLVVANDVSALRLRQVQASALRLGLTCLSLSVGDAAQYEPETGLFDAVLADVPCSCEGTSRKNREVLRRPPITAALDPDAILQGVQAHILLRALAACRPGGRVVYSTCTYAPEENEAVVSAVLGALEPGAARVCEVSLPGFAPAPGLAEWRGARFHPSVTRALRFWPHTHDTGGFFVAVLEVAK